MTKQPELVVFEITLVENGEERNWESTIVLEDEGDWHKAAIRWLTNLCGTFNTVDNVFPVGSLHCRRKEAAIYDTETDSFRISEYKYYGRISEDEWKIA